MSSVAEIQEAIAKLSPAERTALGLWLRTQEEPDMSAEEETELLASLDRAAQQLDEGKGVPLAEVRGMVGKWAGR